MCQRPQQADKHLIGQGRWLVGEERSTQLSKADWAQAELPGESSQDQEGGHGIACKFSIINETQMEDSSSMVGACSFPDLQY